MIHTQKPGSSHSVPRPQLGRSSACVYGMHFRRLARALDSQAVCDRLQALWTPPSSSLV